MDRWTLSSSSDESKSYLEIEAAEDDDDDAEDDTGAEDGDGSGIDSGKSPLFASSTSVETGKFVPLLLLYFPFTFSFASLIFSAKEIFGFSLPLIVTPTASPNRLNSLCCLQLCTPVILTYDVQYPISICAA